MFDIAFSELLVIAVVALLVIGPEKLPKVARSVGAFTGRMQRYMAQVKEEINREMRFEELQKLQQEIKQSVENTQSSLHQQIAEIQTSSSEKAQTADDAKPKSSKIKRTKPAAKPSPKPSPKPSK